MLKQIFLRNFKAFEELQIKLKPITIFLGPNNSGKSSILSAPRILAQTVESYDPTPPLLLKGIFGDFGTYRDVVFSNNRRRIIKMGISIGPGDYEEGSKRSYRKVQRDVSFEIDFKYRAKRREITLSRFTLKEGGEHLLSTKYSQDTDRQVVEKISKEVVPPELRSSLSNQVKMQNFIPRMAYMGTSRRKKGSVIDEWIETQRLGSKLDCIRRAAFDINLALRSIEYLGPLRAPPERLYPFAGERRKQVGIAGEYAADIFVSDISRQRTKSLLMLQINKWLSSSSTAKEIKVVPISDRHYEIRVSHQQTGEDQNLADVGYGISQILPVLVGGVNCPPGTCYIVEQPEIHLHPRAQVHLAQFFVDLMDKGVQSLIETHSEYLVIGLQELIASEKLRVEDVGLYYLYAEEGLKKITRIGLDEKGRFIDEWPEGFFPERLDQARKLSIARSNTLT